MNTEEWNEAQKYLAFVTEAGEQYALEPALLLAVMSRESLCGLAIKKDGTGDKVARRGRMPQDGLGFGRGLMQIDYDAHEFARSSAWKDPRQNILYGARVLRDSINYMNRKHMADPVRAGVAGYNRGPGNIVRDVEAGLDIDHFTAGRDYSADVLRRKAWFEERLTFWQNEQRRRRTEGGRVSLEEEAVPVTTPPRSRSRVAGVSRAEPLPPETLPIPPIP